MLEPKKPESTANVVLQRSRVTTDADARLDRPAEHLRGGGLQRSRVTTDADAVRREAGAVVRIAASTEPRHDGRGCLSVRGRVSSQSNASTEPRHDGRGCVPPGYGSRPLTTSFNGAASRRTRMRYHQVGGERVLSSFNGAASRRTRMRVRPRSFLERRLASTEPRHDGRGCEDHARRHRPHHAASTEPRHDGRGCPAYDAKPLAHCRASTEPRHDGRGCVFGSSNERKRRSASTEPRHDGRGCWAIRSSASGCTGASTEPRHDGRGCMTRPAPGHRLPLASTEPRHDGRGCGTDRRTRPGCGTRFNGAASRRTRMLAALLLLLKVNEMLQRSRVTTDADARVRRPLGVRATHASTEPRHDGRGCEDTRVVCQQSVTASTEPRHDGRGCLTCVELGLPTAICFNGAASRRTRMPYTPTGTSGTTGSLQRSRVTTDADARARHDRRAAAQPLQRSRVTTDADAISARSRDRKPTAASTEPRHDGRGCRAYRRPC